MRLNLPQYKLSVKKRDRGEEIFDPARRIWVALTPEEWVRQNYIQFLVQDRGYPLGLTAVEKTISLNGLKKRPDIVVYNSEAKPIVIVECKAPSVKITQKTFDQIAQYNIKLQVPILVVTNGLEHYYCEIDFHRNSIKYIKDIPHYSK